MRRLCFVRWAVYDGGRDEQERHSARDSPDGLQRCRAVIVHDGECGPFVDSGRGGAADDAIRSFHPGDYRLRGDRQKFFVQKRKKENNFKILKNYLSHVAKYTRRIV